MRRRSATCPAASTRPCARFAPSAARRASSRAARGSSVWDVDGNRYIDYLASWGPLIAGHAHPGVVAAIQEAATRGTSYGAPTESEVELAELVKQAFPSIDLVRFVSSGTEATMSALRLARAVHRPRHDPQVRRRLPRPRRRPARAGRLWPADASASPIRPACPRAPPARRCRCPTTTWPPSATRSRRTRARSPRSSSSRSPATWASSRPSRAFSSTCAR